MHDPMGYYATLEVPPSASISEIKSAYRRLAKKYHPDKEGGVGDVGRIVAINLAYDVLSDPNSRAEYDRPKRQRSSGENRQAIEPLRCHACRKIAALPRNLVFWRVASLILATSSSPVQGIYCANCANAEAIRSTVITSLFGWWGFPWGPIMTMGKGFRNAVGGERDSERDEAMAWYNAVAFAQAGQVQLAYAIADYLSIAKDPEIRESAENLARLCLQDGASSAGKLKDPWLQVKAQSPLRIAILAMIPAIAAGLILANSDFDSQSSVVQSTPESPYGAGQTAPPQAQAPDKSDQFVEPPIQVGQCSKSFANGQILSGRKNLADEGHRLEISNGSTGDAIVKIRDSASNKTYASFYVKQDQTASIDGISDGTYRIQYSIGKTLDQKCKKFINPYVVGFFPQTEGLYSRIVDDYRGSGIIYQRLSYTLYSVAGGNIHPETMSEQEFDAE
ncbi:MAG: J domain-containing protein [Novosphingobium sp.]|nr:J domain-containing protein [Novosphingobium sp.]